MPARREQIRNTLRHRVVSGLHLGILSPGERLTSARETARELGADYRVVVAALRDLERDGLVEVRARSGIFVAATAHRREAALPRMAGRMVEILVEAVTGGMPALEFPERVRRCLETLRLRAACLECNQDQLSFLCHELQVDYGLETSDIDLTALQPDEPLPVELRRADLLVSTSFHAGEVRRLAHSLGKPFVIVVLEPAFRSELTRLLAVRPVYFVGTDPRFAEKLRLLLGDEPGAANLRPVILGRDPLEQIPDDAPLLVSPAARARLAEHPSLARALPPRGYSRETARQILTFIVERNVAALMAESVGGPGPGIGGRDPGGSG